MRVLICDLDRRQREASRLDAAYGAVFGREELESAHSCIGCFGCWVKTPGRCVIDDALGDLAPALGAADGLDIVSESRFGGYGALVKRALDRSLGYLHPDFRIAEGAMHHRPRYDRPLSVRIWLYGTSTERERATFMRLAAANAVNLNARIEGIWFPASAVDAGRADALENRWPPSPDAARSGMREAPSGPGAACGGAQDVPPGPAAAHRRAPERIALIDASPKATGSATECLLDDFADALAAYARLSRAAVPAMDRLSCTAGGALAGRDETDLSACDALVIGYPLYFDALPSHLVALLDRIAGSRSLAPATRVYAIVNLGFYEAEQGVLSFELMRGFCRDAGALWCGGLAAGGGGMIVPTRDSPRMGSARRARSQAIDALIAAVRLGATVSDARERTRDRRRDGTDTILARCPIPRFCYRLAAELGWRRMAHASGVRLSDRP